MSLLLWLEVAGDMGIRRAVTKLIPEASDPRVVVHLASAMLLIVSLVLFALCWILAPFVADFFELGENGAWLFRVAVLDLPFNGLYLAYQGILQGHLLLGTLSKTLVVYSIAKLAGIASLLLLGMSVEAALIVNVLATVAALVYAFVKYPISIAFPAGPMRRTIIGIAIPIGIFGGTMQLLLWMHLWSLEGDIPCLGRDHRVLCGSLEPGSSADRRTLCSDRRRAGIGFTCSCPPGRRAGTAQHPGGMPLRLCAAASGMRAWCNRCNAHHGIRILRKLCGRRSVPGPVADGFLPVFPSGYAAAHDDRGRKVLPGHDWPDRAATGFLCPRRAAHTPIWSGGRRHRVCADPGNRYGWHRCSGSTTDSAPR